MKWSQSSAQEDFLTVFLEGALMASARIAMKAARRIGRICRRFSLRGGILFRTRVVVVLCHARFNFLLKGYPVPRCVAVCCLRFATEVAVRREAPAHPGCVPWRRGGTALLEN